MIGASQLRVGQLGFVHTKSRVDGADSSVELLSGGFESVVAHRFVVTVAQTADCYLLVNVQRDDSSFSVKDRLNNVVVLVDQMRWILRRT